MTIDLLSTLAAWWAGLGPDFRFLLGLPFAVGFVGWLADGRVRPQDE